MGDRKRVTCTKCKVQKDYKLFYKANNKKGHMAACKECKKAESRANNSKHHVKLRKKLYSKEWTRLNKLRKYSNDTRWQKENLDRYKKSKKRWFIENKEKRREYIKNWKQNKFKNDASYRLAHNLRSRVSRAVQKDLKGGSAVRDLGCSIDHLKKHLEAQFKPGMSWDNYGKDGWHIDHIKPLSSFDLTDPEQLKKACHYSNLQPLWWNDNIKKGNKETDHE